MFDVHAILWSRIHVEIGQSYNGLAFLNWTVRKSDICRPVTVGGAGC